MASHLRAALRDARRTVRKLEAAIAAEDAKPRAGKPARICALCDESYDAGTYSVHRITHTPKRPKRAGGPPRFPERDVEITRLMAAGALTEAQIGERFGITRERARQIAKKNGVTRGGIRVPARPRAYAVSRCPVCTATVPKGTLAQHRLDAGHAAAKVQKAERQRITDLYEQGYGYHAISKVVGVGPQSVKRYIVMAGIPPHRVGTYDRGRPRLSVVA